MAKDLHGSKNIKPKNSVKDIYKKRFMDALHYTPLIFPKDFSEVSNFDG
jgi:hypothetical protein